jgi:hypothetical protein
MKDMRADMGGAATTLSAAWAIATLKIPVNLVLCIPLTENMPSGHATKPGDIIIAANGVTIVSLPSLYSSQTADACDETGSRQVSFLRN